jgi:hypothetical protein
MSLVTGKKGGCGQQVCVGIYIKACVELCLLYNTNHQSNPALCKREWSFSYIMDTTKKVATTARERKNTLKVDTEYGLSTEQKSTILASVKDIFRAKEIVEGACHALLVLMGFDKSVHVNKVRQWTPDPLLWDAVEHDFKFQLGKLIRPTVEHKYPKDDEGLKKHVKEKTKQIWSKTFLTYVKSEKVPVYVQFPRRPKEITQADIDKMTPEQILAYKVKQEQSKLAEDVKDIIDAVRSMNTARKNNIKLRATGNRQNIDKEAEKKFSAIGRICSEWKETIENRVNNEA